MSDTGKQSPLGVNSMAGLIQNKGLTINKIGASYMGSAKSLSDYTFGTLIQNTVLRLLTWSINDAYGRNVVNSGTYQNLISVGEYLDWYPVTSGSWGSFMNSYAIWTNGQTDVATYTYTTGVNFPATGLYTFNYAAQNTMTVSLDGTAIGAATTNHTTNDSITMNVLAGDHIINMAITGTGTATGGALQIIKPIGGELWDSRSYLASQTIIPAPSYYNQGGTGGGYAPSSVAPGTSTGGAYNSGSGAGIKTITLNSVDQTTTFVFVNGWTQSIPTNAPVADTIAQLQADNSKVGGSVYDIAIINYLKGENYEGGNWDPNITLKLNDATVVWGNTFNPTWSGTALSKYQLTIYYSGDSQSTTGNAPSGSLTLTTSAIGNPANITNNQSDAQGKYSVYSLAMALYDPVQKYVVYASAASLKVYAPNGAGANTTTNTNMTPSQPPVVFISPGTTVPADGKSVLTVSWSVTGAYPDPDGVSVSDTLGNKSTSASGSFSYGPYSPGTTGDTNIFVDAKGPGGGFSTSRFLQIKG